MNFLLNTTVLAQVQDVAQKPIGPDHCTLPTTDLIADVVPAAVMSGGQLGLWVNLLYLVEIFLIFGIAKFTFDRIANFDVKKELVENDNFAFMISYVGYFIAIGVILFTVLNGDSQQLFIAYQQELITNPKEALKHFLMSQTSDILVYSLMGISLLFLSRIILDQLILKQFSIHKELLVDRNAGTGMVLLGTYVSSALVISAALSGEEPALLSPIIYFCIGQLFLVLFTKVYTRLLPFDVHTEIERDNVAVGTAYGCTMIAVGILLHKGLSGDFHNLTQFATQFSYYSLTGLIAFPLVRWLFDRVYLAHLNLTHELTHDRNVGIGLLEGTFAILVALSIYFAF